MYKDHKIATIINYCSNELCFLEHVLKNAKKISSQVIVVLADHFFDGEKEDLFSVYSAFSKFPNVEFIIYPLFENFLIKRLLKKIGKNNFWHSFSRFIGFQFLKKDIENVLFLDADEIIDSDRFLNWLDNFEYQNYNAIKLANYWYFRESKYQSKNYEDSVVFIKKKKITCKMLLHKEERNALYNLAKLKKIRMVKGLNKKPLIHHYSWVRTKKDLLKKINSWGHKDDKDWKTFVEKEFEGEFTLKDFVHGYEYVEIKPFVNIDLDKKENSKSFIKPQNVRKISRQEILRILLKKYLTLP